jgi:Skp family chaperone for outer membrane proteins
VENPETLTIGGLILMLITAWFKVKPAMLKIEADSDTSLRSDLFQRIETLEKKLDQERKDCDDKLAKLRSEHVADIAALKTDYQKRLDELQTYLTHLINQGKNTNVRSKGNSPRAQSKRRGSEANGD